ncbi:hypothetical protein AMTRI_Chr03g47390 [Amborella trichopoda]
MEMAEPSINSSLSLYTKLISSGVSLLSSFISHAAALALPSQFSLSRRSPLSLLTDLSVAHTEALPLSSHSLYHSPSRRSSSSSALSIIVEAVAAEPYLTNTESFDYILN